MKNRFILLICAITQSIFAFNGEIQLNYSNFNSGDFKVQSVNWLFKNDQAKMTLTMLDDKGITNVSSFIPNKSSQSLLIYNNMPSADGKNYYYQVPVNKIEDLKNTEYRVEKTTEQKLIAGYNCIKYMVYTATTITEMWVCTSIELNYGSWASFFKTNAEMQGLMKIGINGFPLESTTKSLAGNIIFQYTATSVNTDKTIEDKEFTVPSGYILVSNNK